MTPEMIAQIVQDAVRAAITRGDLDLPVEVADADVVIERPRNREHGDYATNVAMQLAKQAQTNPRALAEAIVPGIIAADGVAEVQVAGPGFINITVAAEAAGKIAAEIIAAGRAYGRSSVLAGQRINLEFISANPTGPLHLGHTRWAAVGDAMARVLEAAGAEVTREFYVNDRGVQMDRFGESIAAAAAGKPVPEDGYAGEYINDLADQILTEHPEFADLTGNERVEAFREEGYRLQLAQQQHVLDDFGTHFQVWYSERSLHDSGAVQRAFDKLTAQGHTFDADGAFWLRTTEFGDDKDRVLVKSDGEQTYFASDAAYYVDKRDRGFDVNIYLLGADHHGYVGRLKAIAACAGDDPDRNIEVLIGQLVKIMRGGEEVRLSKRAGNIVTLEDLVDEVGVDAARYTLSRYPADSPLVMDLDVLVSRTNDNPVFTVQYAHARICSVLRNAADLGIDYVGAPFEPGLLASEQESDLLGALAEFPRVVASAAELREPHRVARYLEDLAGTYHRFYDACRVLPLAGQDVEPIHIARLWLCAATRQTLENGLGLLGVSAPERM